MIVDVDPLGLGNTLYLKVRKRCLFHLNASGCVVIQILNYELHELIGTTTVNKYFEFYYLTTSNDTLRLHCQSTDEPNGSEILGLSKLQGCDVKRVELQAGQNFANLATSLDCFVVCSLVWEIGCDILAKQ